ncbi:hypothetical protein F5884DRAFT_75778 [Xylogone sp. PMI_703]|nr:hypothetical protein F5884DRAFT_75778 [Xylogone sp. PMI_703]
MFAEKLLLVALGAVTVSAATNTVCSQPTATVSSQADANLLQGCKTVTGDVLITSDAGGGISLDGPQAISGDLIVKNAGALTTLTSSSIGSISGTFNLNNLTVLSTLAFNELETVGSINWIALPALSQLTFPATVSKASNVVISNTFLSTLDGINIDTAETVDINNNNRLKTFSTQIVNVTSILSIDSNGQQLDVEFPNLENAANMTIRKVASLSIPSLKVVSGSLGIVETSVTSIFAPNLTSVGVTTTGNGGLAIDTNNQLTNLSIPLLQKVGGAVQIANNTKLFKIGFPALTTVGGAIDFSGNFSDPSLPKLTNVAGGFNMQSQSSIDCDNFQKEHDSGVIQGKFTCLTAPTVHSGVGSGSTSTSGSGSSGTSTSASSSSTHSTNAAVPNSVGAQAVVGLSVVGGLLQMLL